MVFAVPIPAENEIDSLLIKQAIEQALSEASAQKVSGPQLTPILIRRVSELTGGES